MKDQQQQILRDTDELRERMEREENRDRMAEARQQVDESREHVRQASEAIEQGRVPQALTEGTRAGRQLSEVRDELRKQAANRFSQEMTEMRDQARHLDENQKKLAEQLDASKDRQQTSLRDTGEKKKVAEGLGQQQQKLDKLLEQMRTTVQNAEENEPILAKNLYDTVKKANEQKIDAALKAAEQLVDLELLKTRPRRRITRVKGSNRCVKAWNVRPGASLATKPPHCAERRANSKTLPIRSIRKSPKPPAPSLPQDEAEPIPTGLVPQGQDRGGQGQQAPDPLAGLELRPNQPGDQAGPTARSTTRRRPERPAAARSTTPA